MVHRPTIAIAVRSTQLAILANVARGFFSTPRLGPATLSGPLQLHYKSAFQQCHRCEWCLFALITVIAGQSLFLLLLCYGGHEMGVFWVAFTQNRTQWPLNWTGSRHFIEYFMARLLCRHFG